MIGFLREPLVQFLVIGAVLFALDRATQPEAVDPNVIRIDEKVQRDLLAVFEEEAGRKPRRDEMDRMVERYIENEVMYREARSLRLEDGDQMMRERLMTRMRNMLFSGIQVPPPEEAVLRAWFEADPERFVTPERLTIEIIGLDTDEAQAEAVAERLRAGASMRAAAPQGAYPVTLARRPRSQLVQLLGAQLMAAIEGGELGVWQRVDSPRGWQVARLVERLPAIRPDFEEIQAEAATQWRAERVRMEARAALDAMMSSYPVERLPYAEGILAETDGEAAVNGPAAVR
ncbi:MAG: peptidyl-prolyl cis-trans isomerase [Pikeienuella sp.]